jgi:hypothetical protein
MHRPTCHSKPSEGTPPRAPQGLGNPRLPPAPNSRRHGLSRRTTATSCAELRGPAAARWRRRRTSPGPPCWRKLLPYDPTVRPSRRFCPLPLVLAWKGGLLPLCRHMFLYPPQPVLTMSKYPGSNRFLRYQPRGMPRPQHLRHGNLTPQHQRGPRGAKDQGARHRRPPAQQEHLRRWTRTQPSGPSQRVLPSQARLCLHPSVRRPRTRRQQCSVVRLLPLRHPQQAERTSYRVKRFHHHHDLPLS